MANFKRRAKALIITVTLCLLTSVADAKTIKLLCKATVSENVMAVTTIDTNRGVIFFSTIGFDDIEAQINKFLKENETTSVELQTFMKKRGLSKQYSFESSDLDYTFTTYIMRDGNVEIRFDKIDRVSGEYWIYLQKWVYNKKKGEYELNLDGLSDTPSFTCQIWNKSSQLF